jgi:hypothetical protein
MKNAILSYLKNYGLKAIAGLSGFQAVLANLALKYCWKYVGPYYDRLAAYLLGEYNKAKNAWLKKADQKDAVKYEENLKDGVTQDEQKDATTDLLNG